MGKRVKYNKKYYVLFTISIDNNFVKAYIYNSETQTHKIIKNKETLQTIFENIYNHTESPELTRIYCNKCSIDVLKPFGNTENYPLFNIRTYDDILPNYTSWVPAEFDEDYYIKCLYDIANEISFYVNKIGLNKFKKTHQNSGFGKIAAHCLEVDYPDLINADNVLDVIKRSPPSRYISIIKNVKDYGANCIISKHSNGAIYTNVTKLDIDSSFNLVPILGKTIINLRFHKNYTISGLNDIIKEGKKGFFVVLKLNQQPILKNYEYSDFLYKDKNEDIGNGTKSKLGINRYPQVITLTHLGFKNLFEIYDLNINLIKIEKVLIGDLVDYLPFQKELITRLHKDKSYYKQINNVLEKNKTKKIIHCLHGRGQMNMYDNISIYREKWETKGKRFQAPGDFIFNYVDSVMMYEYARDAILNIIKLCYKNKQHVYYYDTDCVVIPNNVVVDTIQNCYNEYILNCYKSKGYDIKDYTHYGHTIGLLEKEVVYDKFTYRQGKFYLYETDGKLYSTTSGFPTNLIANKIEETTGLKGMDAFTVPKNINLDLGWVYSPTKNSLMPLIFEK